MIIKLNPELKIEKVRRPTHINDLIDKLSKHEFVEDNLIGDYYHLNYLSYLEYCWSSHLGVVVTPDIIWYTILSEVAQSVLANPEKYRHLFTDSNEKKNILVSDDTYPVLNLNEVVSQLRDLVPGGLTNELMGDFTTSNSRSTEARYSVFCDMVSPFYNYIMYCCGISKIDVRGTEVDWLDLLSRFNVLNEKGLVSNDYWLKVKDILSSVVLEFSPQKPSWTSSIIIDPNPIKEKINDKKFWGQMFMPKYCGSGSQIELNGWFTDLFINQPRTRFSSNFSSHVSNVNYEHLPTKQKFVMKQGLLSSTIKGDFLEPEFGRIIYKIKNDKN